MPKKSINLDQLRGKDCTQWAKESSSYQGVQKAYDLKGTEFSIIVTDSGVWSWDGIVNDKWHETEEAAVRDALKQDKINKRISNQPSPLRQGFED